MSDTGKGVRGKLDEDKNKSETGQKMTGLGLLQLILYSPNNDTLERLYLELLGPVVLMIDLSRPASPPLRSSNTASGLREATAMEKHRVWMDVPSRFGAH